MYLDKSNGIKSFNGVIKPLNVINNIKKNNVKDKNCQIYTKWDSNIKL